MRKTHFWLQGAGLAMLYLLPLIASFLSSSQDGFYHQVMPITSLTRGVLLDLLLLSVLLGAGIAWLEGMRSDLLRQCLWLLVLFVIAWVAERGAVAFLHNISNTIYLPEWLSHVPWIMLAIFVALLVFARRYYGFVIKAATFFLASAGIASVFVVLPQLVYASFNHAPPEQASFSRPVSRPWRPGESRIVWLLFDELSYNQAFEHPQPGIHLPAFSRLQQESVSFSQLTARGNFTDYIVPSLLLGKPISAVKSNRRGELLWRYGANHDWHQFDASATVFAEAQRQNWSTGIAGWYNPYCRLLADVLDRCYWSFQDFGGGSRFSRLSSERSTLQNARDALPLVPQIENVLEHGKASRGHTSQSHNKDFRSVLHEAKSLIADQEIRFAFIHLAVPHPPGIYPDPLQPGREDYLGNLILADQTLAELGAEIQKTPAAADTILVVSSDHSWRVPFWRSAPGWTPAEERATDGGVFDQRPVLMVRFPGQNKPQQINRPQSEMIVHGLLLDLIEGKVRTPEEWIESLSSGIPNANQADLTAKK